MTGDAVNRYEAAECIFETGRPIAFDPFDINQETGRFVIVHDYEIQGGGIILDSVNNEHVRKSEKEMFMIITDKCPALNKTEELKHARVISIKENDFVEVLDFMKEKGLIKK